jgi:hypothetical protein
MKKEGVPPPVCDRCNPAEFPVNSLFQNQIYEFRAEFDDSGLELEKFAVNFPVLRNLDQIIVKIRERWIWAAFET